jgi:ABC-type branched-subunit amino acid transport system permease subunit
MHSGRSTVWAMLLGVLSAAAFLGLLSAAEAVRSPTFPGDPRPQLLVYLLAGALAGLGGALAALAVGHVDPEMTYWTTSGEFVFIAILGGIQSILAPFVAATIFEALRMIASQYAPNVWQMSLGLAMLAIIMFLPAGLWTLAERRRRSA